MSSFPLGSRAESEDRCLGWLSHFKQCLNGLCCRPAAAHCKNRENIKRWADSRPRQRERERKICRGDGRPAALAQRLFSGREDRRIMEKGLCPTTNLTSRRSPPAPGSLPLASHWSVRSSQVVLYLYPEKSKSNATFGCLMCDEIPIFIVCVNPTKPHFVTPARAGTPSRNSNELEWKK